MEQSVFRGFSRRVKGHDGRATAQFTRLRGSTQPFPFGHNGTQRFCLDGRVTGIETWGVVRVITVVPRGDGVRLPGEKSQFNQRMFNTNSEADREQAAVPHGMGPTHKRTRQRFDHEQINKDDAKRVKVTDKDAGRATGSNRARIDRRSVHC